MKKSLKLSVFILIVAIISASVFTLTACEKQPTHTHVWGEWHRDETEHWRYCTVEDCGTQQYENHLDSPCSVCGYGFRVLAFGYDEGGDTAHSDFAREANIWFPARGAEFGFSYDFVGTDYSYLNDETLSNYDMVIFLNDRPWYYEHQDAFERFMLSGGAWMGFHSAAFSMDGVNEYWDWYQSDFLGCGNYAKNTWNPTSEPLTVETRNHCATKNIVEDIFTSAPCEWYGWEFDLFGNNDITVLLTLNPTEDNPAGDQPEPSKQHEIWYDGHYPIAWANNNYNMVYMNWGHNLQSYNTGAEGAQSSTFASETQNQFMIDAMFGLVLAKLNANI